MRIRSAAIAAVVVSCVTTSGSAWAGEQHGAPPRAGSASDAPFTFAVIGDTPYGPEQIASFPARIDEINADPQVDLVDHLGDIKNGSTPCTDAYFAEVKSQFDRFADPLVYTPGDNEWTDCHRPNNGSYNPLERLATLRQVFFPRPGRTLGEHPARVDSQAAQGYPENVSYERGRVAFAAVHIVGSNNSLAPWTGRTTATPEQTAEVIGRTAAAIALIRDTFRRAKSHRDRAVVLLTQADMFDATVTGPEFADYYAFQPIVRAIAEESAAYRGQVYLFNGDSHVYRQDEPLAGGSPWLSFYGIDSAADNLTRVTVEGSTGVDEWLKVSVNRRGAEVLTIERVLFAN
jgi:hypothetical protein